MSWQQGADSRSAASPIQEAGRTGVVHAVAGLSTTGEGTLASDADREIAARLLSEAFAVGRLTAGEHGDRVQAAYNARTWADLNELTADLPAQTSAAYALPAAGQPPGDAGRCPLCALLISCPPAGIAWLVASWRRARARADGPGAVWPASARDGNGKHAEDR